MDGRTGEEKDRHSTFLPLSFTHLCFLCFVRFGLEGCSCGPEGGGLWLIYNVYVGGLSSAPNNVLCHYGVTGRFSFYGSKYGQDGEKLAASFPLFILLLRGLAG